MITIQDCGKGDVQGHYWPMLPRCPPLEVVVYLAEQPDRHQEVLPIHLENNDVLVISKNFN